jgi:hypothetical protein
VFIINFILVAACIFKSELMSDEYVVQKIISGGQSGVDRAALDVGLQLGIPFYNLWTNIPFINSCFNDP